MPTLKRTLEFIMRVHAGQFDSIGVPYYLHPVAVYEGLPLDSDEDEKHAALLHDVIEDTKHTVKTLRMRGYSEKTIRIVSLISRDKDDGKTYNQFIKSIAESGDAGAMRVKMADLAHNSDPMRLSHLPATKASSLGKRYAKAMATLTTALERL